MIALEQRRNNEAGKRICSVPECIRRKGLIRFGIFKICELHFKNRHAYYIDYGEEYKQPLKNKTFSEQKARGHQPSVPLKRLPILECEAGPPGGCAVMKPIPEVFGTKNNSKK